jgi:sigma-B regulation protein RsbU (phosphoserine phosphatase)
VKILIAEDDPVSRRVLEASLTKWGHEVVVTKDGAEAWGRLSNEPLRLAILDWMMPEIDGVEVCRRVRARPGAEYVYVILLTAKSHKADLVVAMEAGADDFVAKPFDAAELRTRVLAGERIIGLKTELEDKIRELEHALAHVKQLQGLIPICMHCKKIRTDPSNWQSIETYIEEHTDASFSHGICSQCMAKYYPE